MREKLPYRPNVSIICFADDEFLVINRIRDQTGAWKFPQGGIEQGEDVIRAAKREFAEEIGDHDIRVIGVSKITNTYEWSDEQIIEERKQGKHFRGQKQQFVIAKFNGDKKEIDVCKDEVSEHKWITREQVHEYSKREQHQHFSHYNQKILDVLLEFDI